MLYFHFSPPFDKRVLFNVVCVVLQVEMLPDIAHAPRILPNYTQNIPPNLKKVYIGTQLILTDDFLHRR